MSISIEIQKKPKENIEVRQICKPKEVFELKEVQEIKDAVQEHLLFIGLDRKNNIRNISLIGIGTSDRVTIDSKYIVRTALISASDKVILVHNHTSNGLESSNLDMHISNITNKLLKVFNIELIDHIIVTENGYTSMMKEKAIDNDYEDSKTEMLNKVFLLEEKNILKKKIIQLKNILQKNVIKEDTEELEL